MAGCREFGGVRIGLLGAGFVAGVHAEALREVHGAHVTAVFSRNAARAQAFAAAHGVPRWSDDWKAVATGSDVDLVLVLLPNFMHAEATLAAAGAGKHVLVERPLCLTLAEADAMIDACRRAGVMLGYAEQLCFTPKYERVRQLAAAGAFGRLHFLRQSEKHSGPHTDWFWDVTRSGGGVLMDMGCHAFGWFRWVLGPTWRPVEVTCRCETAVHSGRTAGEDQSIAAVVFENDQGWRVTALAENAWTRLGGMDDRIEVAGTRGGASADLFQGGSAQIYSEDGYEYALEKAGGTRGWSFALAEEVHQQGYPHELQHFIDCVREGRPPCVGGEDGRAVLELTLAAYASAGRGATVHLPYTPPEGTRVPVELWRNPRP